MCVCVCVFSELQELYEYIVCTRRGLFHISWIIPMVWTRT